MSIAPVYKIQRVVQPYLIIGKIAILVLGSLIYLYVDRFFSRPSALQKGALPTDFSNSELEPNLKDV